MFSDYKINKQTNGQTINICCGNKESRVKQSLWFYPVLVSHKSIYLDSSTSPLQFS